MISIALQKSQNKIKSHCITVKDRFPLLNNNSINVVDSYIMESCNDIRDTLC